MASRFVGSPVRLTLSDGSVIEGRLSQIDVQLGTLTLERAVVHRDGFERLQVNTRVVQRAQVKDIQVLASESPAPSSPLAPAPPAVAVPAPNLPNLRQSTSGLTGLQPPSNLNAAALNQIQDPAILSFGRKAPLSDASSRPPSRAPSRLGYQPSPPDFPSPAAVALASPNASTPRHAPSSHASNSTIAARSTASVPVPVHQSPATGAVRPGLPQSASSGRQHTAKTLLKKQQQKQQLQQQQQIARRFIGGAETAGSEADESHVANSEAPNIRRKGQSNNSSARPKQQFVTSLQPDDTEADEAYSTTGSGTGRGTASFNDDFDFTRGLAQFNKQAVFDEIRGADRTDPASRLVAHNRRGEAIAPNKYTTKLRYDENVLEQPEPEREQELELEIPNDDEQEIESEVPTGRRQQYEEYYASVDDASILPRDSVTEGGMHTTDAETVASGDIPAARKSYNPRAAQYPAGERSTGPGSAMLASATAALTGQSPEGSARGGLRQMRTEIGGVQLQAVSDKTWKEVQQLCTIESGPNLVQRVENGARGIASVIFREAAKSPEPAKGGPSVVILCTPCGKGSYGLRAGAHLVNHGAACVAYLPGPVGEQQLPATFEAHLRLYSAAGGRVLRSIDDLPENADFIIDALADNESSAAGASKRNRHDSSIAEAVSWALGCTPLARTTSTPIYSIDLPSNTDPDTGALPANAIWSISPSAVIALGLVKVPSVKAKYSLFLVDIGLPMTAIERAGVKDQKRIFIGDTWVTAVM